MGEAQRSNACALRGETAQNRREPEGLVVRLSEHREHLASARQATADVA